MLLNKDLNIPIYKQLYEAFKQQILSGSYKPGAVLPATRRIANDLAISRTSVINAYNQLELEGYITPKGGAGYIVNDLSIYDNYYPKDKIIRDTIQNIPKKEVLKYDFGTARTDPSIFPVNIWKKCLTEALLKDASLPSFSYPNIQGEYPLRKAISDYLFGSRGIDCTPDQIIITSGLEYSLEHVLRLFGEKKLHALMEIPGYYAAYHTLSFHHCNVIPINVDKHGIKTDEIKKLHAELIYITPSHQFPTGAILPIQRRLALIEWANKNNAYILEDDYDSELRYNAKPIPSLYSIDQSNRTIYLGTFSKSFSASIRVAFLVLPKKLILKWYDEPSVMHNSVPTTVQNALADFISSGNYTRYIDRLRTINKKKNTLLIQELKKVFKNKIVLMGEGAGQHILVDIKSPMKEEQLRNTAKDVGVHLHASSQYWHTGKNPHPHQIIIGYGGISLENIPKAIKLLYDAWFK